MILNYDYITDAQGHIKSVILDYQAFQWLEEWILDHQLGQLMTELPNNPESLLSLEEAKRLLEENHDS